MVEWVKIVGLGVVAAIAYGIAHDGVTTRVCVEYFTIGHPPIFGGLTSPTALALGWGVLATWWVGMALGILLAGAARLGTRPRLVAADLLRPLGILLATMAALSAVAGCAGYVAAGRGWVFLVEPLASAIPVDRHRAFLADLWAHLAAYGVAFLGGLGLAIWATVRRSRLARDVSAPPHPLVAS